MMVKLEPPFEFEALFLVKVQVQSVTFDLGLFVDMLMRVIFEIG